MNFQAKREVVAVYVESPIYFTLPLRQRLALVNRQCSGDTTRAALLAWVKTGYFNPTAKLGPVGL